MMSGMRRAEAPFRLSLDRRAVGYALFTAGGGRAWETYELDSFLPRLAEYVVSQKP